MAKKKPVVEEEVVEEVVDAGDDAEAADVEAAEAVVEESAEDQQLKADRAALGLDLETGDPDMGLVGVDVSNQGLYAYVPAPDGAVKERKVVVAGASCEHVAEDLYGRWLYRKM